MRLSHPGLTNNKPTVFFLFHSLRSFKHKYNMFSTKSLTHVLITALCLESPLSIGSMNGGRSGIGRSPTKVLAPEVLGLSDGDWSTATEAMDSPSSSSRRLSMEQPGTSAVNRLNSQTFSSSSKETMFTAQSPEFERVFNVPFHGSPPPPLSQRIVEIGGKAAISSKNVIGNCVFFPKNASMIDVVELRCRALVFPRIARFFEFVRDVLNKTANVLDPNPR